MGTLQHNSIQETKIIIIKEINARRNGAKTNRVSIEDIVE